MKTFQLTVLAILMYSLFIDCTATIDSEVPTITVPLKMGENEYSLTFPAEKESAITMARKFCSEKSGVLFEGGDLQLTQCTSELGAYLTKELLKKTTSNKTKRSNVQNNIETIKVSFGIGGITYNIDFLPDLDNPHAAAQKFCSQNLNSLGISSHRLLDCVEPVEKHLESILCERRKENRGEKN